MFNKKSRSNNVFHSSIIALSTSMIKLIIPFVYRMIFVHYLSVEYLGINGLFSNVLSVLSLMDLGVGTAIIYRFYQPIHNDDMEKVGQLLNFFKNIYMMIALIITAAGLCLLPFIHLIVKDSGEIPQDINLEIVYVLFLVQTVASYLYSYKQSLLMADQRQYLVSLFHMIIYIFNYGFQIVFLILTRKFIVMLSVSIIVTIVLNYIFSLWITARYKQVFQITSQLSKKERWSIFHDTKACMMHKVGSTVLSATDNIVLTHFVSLAATGMYSNYIFILTGINGVQAQFFGSFTASIGNMNASVDLEAQYRIYKRMIFLNFVFSGWAALGLVFLADEFIALWLGREMTLGFHVSLLLGIQFYLNSIRQITGAYTEATGLIVKDYFRPLIESVINLIVSIVLARFWGVAGVLLGTIISNICTVAWRCPYILYHYHFHRGTKAYWIIFFKYLLTIGVVGFLFTGLEVSLKKFPICVEIFLLKGILLTIVYGTMEVIFWHRTEEFDYYVNMVRRLWRARKNM